MNAIFALLIIGVCLQQDKRCVTETCSSNTLRSPKQCKIFSNQTTCNNILERYSYEDCSGEATDTEDNHREAYKKKYLAIAIAVPCTFVAVLLITAIPVTLVYYWKFKLKIIRESHQHEAVRSSNEAPLGRLPYDNPMYSEVDIKIIGQQCTNPPPLPSRPHYYEEIDSDHTAAAGAAEEYDRLTTGSLKLTVLSANEGKNEGHAYEEPADVLGITFPSKQMQILNKNEQEKQVDGYQKPEEALKGNQT